MKFKGIRQLILGAVAATTATGIVVYGAMAYQAGWDFTPSGENRALNVNQVVFPDGDKTSSQQQNGESNSELWQKDDTANETDRPQQSEQADYLFQSQQTTGTGNATQNIENSASDTVSRETTKGLQTETTQTAALNNGQTGGTADEVYDLTGDTTNADLIIGGSDTSNGSADGNQQPSAEPIPRPTAVPGPCASPTPGGEVTPKPSAPSTPTMRPSEIASDPAISDSDTTVKDPTRVITLPFNENAVANIPESNRHTILMQRNSSADAFYTGQTLDIETIFKLMKLAVRDTKSSIDYKWTWEQYGTYVTINRLSFDGGKTWTDNFPVTVPENVSEGDMQLEISYRLQANGAWQTEVVTDIFVSQSRVLVLDRVVSEGTSALDSAWIVQSINSQYQNAGDKLCLYSYTENYWKQALGNTSTDKYLTRLFPGWTEKGELLPWLYLVTPGRHVLEPAETVPVDKSIYGVELKNYWITSDYVAAVLGEGNYGALQTLTYYAGADSKDSDGAEYAENLSVPQYIQAVDMPYTPYLSVGYLNLPDTVIYVNTDGVTNECGLQVTKGYTVSGENPRYTAKNGLLHNKTGTEILGVPSGLTSLTVGAEITTVKLPYNSKLKTLTADSVDALPEINYEQMADGGTIYLHDALVDAFILAQRARLNGLKLRVASIEDSSHNYSVQDDLAITSDGALHKALAAATQQLKLPEYVTALKKDSLQYLTKLDLLLLPENGVLVKFEDGWANGTGLTRIGCYTEEQYNAALAVVPEGIEVVMVGHSIGGYTYMTRTEGVELISAPADITYFNGKVPTWDGDELVVTTIGDGAFQNCTSLEWIDLPQETTTIGYQAFKGCTSLQGALIGTTDAIVMEEGAFDDCAALRFVASNSQSGDIRDESFALVSNAGNSMLYAPTECDGYNMNWTAFTPQSGVYSYAMVDCGGGRALYGCDEEGTPWLMLRSGGTVNGALTLPDTTIEIFKEAAQGAKAADGSAFGFDWPENESMRYYMDGSAFADSDIGDVITLPEDIVLGDYVFQNCYKLTEITLPSLWGGITLDWGTFDGCKNLTKVTFGVINYYSSLHAGMFNGCTGGKNGHLDIYFEGYSAPSLLIYGANAKFYFNATDWFDDALEAEHISIHVPESYQNTYLDEWRYAMLGYSKSDTTDGGAYQRLWEDVLFDLYVNGDGISLPTDPEIMAEADRRLTESENRVRTLMGLPTVESSRKYELALDPDTNTVTLTAAHGIEYTTLQQQELEMPNDWTLSYIGTEAFIDSPDLSMVVLPMTLKGIQNGAFKGVTATYGLSLQYMPGNYCDLVGFEEGTPFDFGLPDESINLRDAFWESEGTDEFIQHWTLPLAGYYSYESLYAAKVAELTAEDETPPEKEAVMEAVRSTLMYGENRVRRMLGLEELTDPTDITYSIPDNADAEYTDTETEASTYAIATPETALPVETDSADEAPAEADTAPAQDTPADEPTASPADEPVQELPGPATPETAATEGKESNE